MPIGLQVGNDPRNCDRDHPFPVSSDAYVFTGALALDTNAYAAGDTLADALLVTMPEGWNNLAILHDLFVLDEDDQGIAFDVLLFDRRVTTSAKNAAWNTSDADMRNCLAVVRVTSSDYIDLGSNRVASISNLARFLEVPANGPLYVYTVSQGSGTYTAAGLRLKLGFLR